MWSDLGEVRCVGMMCGETRWGLKDLALNWEQNQTFDCHFR